MKILGVNTGSLGTIESNPDGYCLVELSTDAGLTGRALAYPGAEKVIRTMAADLLEGKDPRGVVTHWQNAEKWMAAHSSANAAHARAVLDIALWDLKAKLNDEPLWKSLGAGRPRVNAYASWVEESPRERSFEDWLKHISGNLGLRAGKLRVNSDSPSLEQAISSLRDTLLENTFEPEIMLEFGDKQPPEEFIRRIRTLEAEFDLTWVSGLSRPGEFLDSLKVSEDIRAAVCAGKTLHHRSDFLPYLQNYAADVIEIDPHYWGITGALQMADAAYGAELPVTLSAYPGNVQVHLAASLPYCMSVEISGAFPLDSPLGSSVWFESGWGQAGDEPGATGDRA